MNVRAVVTRPDGSPMKGVFVEFVSTDTLTILDSGTTDTGGEVIGNPTGPFFVRPRVTGDRHRVLVTNFGNYPCYDAVVDPDGMGNYTTIQAAYDALRTQSGSFSIWLCPGNAGPLLTVAGATATNFYIYGTFNSSITGGTGAAGISVPADTAGNLYLFDIYVAAGAAYSWAIERTGGSAPFIYLDGCSVGAFKWTSGVVKARDTAFTSSATGSSSIYCIEMNGNAHDSRMWNCEFGGTVRPGTETYFYSCAHGGTSVGFDATGGNSSLNVEGHIFRSGGSSYTYYMKIGGGANLNVRNCKASVGATAAILVTSAYSYDGTYAHVVGNSWGCVLGMDIQSSSMANLLYLGNSGPAHFYNPAPTVVQTSGSGSCSDSVFGPNGPSDAKYSISGSRNIFFPAESAIGTSTGGSAPGTATYVVMTLDPTLPYERALTGRNNLFITDGGAGSTVTLDSWAKGSDIASASALAIGATADYYHVTGTTGISSIASTAYSAAVLADTPAAYYRMNEASGQPQDSSGNALHTTVTGGSPTYNQTGATSDGDKAIKLTRASSQYFTTPDNALLDPGDTLTLECWVKKTTDGVAMTLLDKDTNGYILSISSSNTVQFGKQNVGFVVTSTNTLTADGAFHHIVVTKATTTTKMYIDGVDVTGTTSNQTIAATASVLSIGRTTTPPGNYTDATIDEIAIYASALSAARVRAHYAAGLVSIAAGARLLLEFDGAVTLTHSASLILVGAANLTTTAGDVIEFVYEGSGAWRMIDRASGSAPASGKIVTYASDATLSDNRVATAGSGITITDAGTNDGALTFKLGVLTADWAQTGVFKITHAGNFLVQKHAGFGSGAAVSTTNIVVVTETLTDPGGAVALSGILTVALTANNANRMIGLDYKVSGSGSFSLTSGSGGMTGVRSTLNPLTGLTVTDARNFWSVASIGGTATSLAHFYIGDAIGSGAVGTQYGLYIENLDFATTNWAMYSAGGNSSHLGAFTIGANTAPDSQAILDLVGTGLGLLVPRMTTANAPAAATDGMIWYDSTTGKFRAREGGADVDLRSASAPTNALLDGSAHTDTVAQTVSRGSLIYGNSTPKWDELVIGASGKFLRSDGTDASWQVVADEDVSTTGMKATILLQGWQPTTTSGCGAPEKSEVGTTNKHDFYACPFDSASAENAFLHHPMPDNWDGSTVTFRVWWFSKTGYVATTSDGVAFTLKATAYGDGDAIDTAYGTGVTVTDTEGANNEARKTADSSALTIGNSPSAGDLVHWVLTRTVSDGADDLAADAYVIGVVVEYGVSALSS